MTHRTIKAELLTVLRVAVALLAQVCNLCGKLRQRGHKSFAFFGGVLAYFFHGRHERFMLLPALFLPLLLQLGQLIL